MSNALGQSKIKTRVADLGGLVLALSPGEYATRIAQETDKWAKVIKFAGGEAGLIAVECFVLRMVGNGSL